MMTLIKGM